jgi:hypothetical protein
MMDSESFKAAVSPLLKSHDFKKTGATWRRANEARIAVFNVQKSSWGGGTYYVNLGVYFRAIGNEPAPTANRCHVQVRLEVAEPSSVVTEAVAWFDRRSTFADARALADADSKKGLVLKELRPKLA